MPDNKDNLVNDPAQLLQKFLDENNLVLRLNPPLVRQVDGGGIMIEQPLVRVEVKQDSSIK